MRNDLPDWKIEPPDEPEEIDDCYEIGVDLDVEEWQIGRDEKR